MKAVSSVELEWSSYPGQRSSYTQHKPLLRGIPGQPDNFEMYLIRYGTGGSHSPRHRHNFEQFRWAINKPLNFSVGGDIPLGHLGYFPEGTYYGPQTNLAETEMLIVQFGGPSRSGYMSNEALRKGTEQLKKIGEFKGGIYTSVDENGKRFNKDAYEAAWETVAGRPLVYPPSRFSAPMVISCEAMPWIPVANLPGAVRRSLGVFNECGTSAFQLKLASGASYRFGEEAATRLLYVLSGNVETAGEANTAGTAIGLYSGEGAVLRATEDTLVLGFVMPYLDSQSNAVPQDLEEPEKV